MSGMKGALNSAASRIAIATIAFGFIHAGAAIAETQAATSQASATGAPKIELEQIVVTARKREENVQRTPLAVTALTAARIEEQRVVNLQSVNSLVPNLQATPAVGAGSGINFFLRGIGQSAPDPNIDGSVAIYVDGVLRPRAAENMTDLGDLQRIEVLRGPQGTLFGRNTTGGAISLFTKGPTNDFGVREILAYGSQNEFLNRTTLNTGELGNSGFKAKLEYYHRSLDGFVRNTEAPRDKGPGAEDNNGFTGRLQGVLFGKLQVDYGYDYTLQKSQGLDQQTVYVANAAFGAYFAKSPSYGGDAYTVSPTRLTALPIKLLPMQRVESYGHTLNLVDDVSSWLTLKSITGYRNLTDSRPFNGSSQGNLLGLVVDATSPTGSTLKPVNPLLTQQRGVDQYQASEELQALGTIGDVSYVGGLYYFREHSYVTSVQLPTTVNAAGLGVQNLSASNYTYITESYAGFAQVSYKPSLFQQKLELTGGLRYTHDKKSIDEYDLTNNVQTRHFADQAAWGNTSGELSLSYQWTPAVMTYARASTGYKAGGFATNTAIGPYDPETNKSYEAGFKGDFLSHRIRLNAAVFHSDYKNLQISGSVVNPTTGARITTTTNAASAEYNGEEAEFNAILGGGFELDGSAGHVDPTYHQFYFFSAATGLINVASEAKFPWVAKTTGDLGLRYNFPQLSFGALSARVEYSYQSSRYFYALDRVNLLNEILRSPAQELWNARVTLANIPSAHLKALKLEFYVDNIFDKDTYLAGVDSTNYASKIFGRGRSLGLQMTAGF